jgi:hypothetical protein
MSQSLAPSGMSTYLLNMFLNPSDHWTGLTETVSEAKSCSDKYKLLTSNACSQQQPKPEAKAYQPGNPINGNNVPDGTIP